jgi:phage shock protein A
MANTVRDLSQALDEERERRRQIEDELEQLKARMSEWEKGTRRLIEQLCALDVVPDWEPGD